MALLPITVPAFPDVPNAPGVPQLARSALAPFSNIVSLGTGAQQGALWLSASALPEWGIFDAANTKVITPDSIRDFDYRAEYRISNFPVQEGQFASYNKVTMPTDKVVHLVKGGSLGDRTQFLENIDRVAASLDLFNIVTPEKTYLNCNVTRVELTRREASGAFFVEVDMFFVEIQQVTAQYSTTAQATANAKVPAALPAVSQGAVQAQVPSNPVKTAAQKILGVKLPNTSVGGVLGP